MTHPRPYEGPSAASHESPGRGPRRSWPPRLRLGPFPLPRGTDRSRAGRPVQRLTGVVL